MKIDSFLPSGWKLRKWQREFVDLYLDVVQTQLALPVDQKKAFILDAFPGSGKTLAQLLVMKYMLEMGMVDFVVVCVPSKKLKSDFARIALEVFGLDFYAKSGLGNCSPDCYDGIVLTYAQLLNEKTQAILNGWCERVRVFISADEMHHLAEEKKWGEGFANAFRNSAARLMTSGTPFRTDNSSIPWAEYKHNILQIKPPWGYRFGYAEALAAGDVRPVVFHPWDGLVSFSLDIDGETYTFEHRLSDNLDRIYGEEFPKATITKLKGLRRLATIACNPEHPQGTEYVRAQIQSAHARLEQVRAAGHKHAGGLLIAKDCDHANALASVVAEITGEEPCVIHTKTKDFKSRLDAYQHNTSESRQRWLISVLQVTEGVDIKHLRVCIYMTHKTAPLLWTQILGRILRVEKGVIGDQTAHFYQYDDGVDSLDEKAIDEEESVRLRFYSETIKEQKDSVLKDKQPPPPPPPPGNCPVCQDVTSPLFTGMCPGRGNPGCPKLPTENSFVIHGATGFQDEQIFDGEHYKLTEIERVKPLSILWGEPEVICKSRLDKLPREQREFMYAWLETQLT